MRKIVRLISIFLLIILLLLIANNIIYFRKIKIENKKEKTQSILDVKLNDIDLSEIDKLMVVAHPDDDMLFGNDDTCNSGTNYYNERLYGTKRLKSDYNVLVKKNKLTDYVCLLKAKNMYEVNQLKKCSIMPKKKR